MISLKLKIYGIILYSVGDSITDAVIKKCCLEHKQAKKYRY